jgi:hypothetical protein
VAPKRSDDLFYGNAAGDPQADWVDLNKVAIPQADEQQRLLVNLILQANLHRKPLPRFWYFPRGHKAVVVMTGDNHGDGGMQPRFDAYLQQSPANCSVDDWECVRATGYEYVGSNFSDAQANYYDDQGFEVALHVNTNCADWTRTSLDNAIASQFSAFGSALPSVPLPSTNRTHCIAWSDWSSQPEVELARGIRLDTNYYYWPPAWVQNRPGMFTGSGMPMRFAKTDGTIIDCYQVTTQMTDESNQTYPMTSDSLLARALDVRGYYGAFCANMHFDFVPDPRSDAIVASALARGVPVVSAKQLLTWLDGRNGSSFSNLGWSGNALSFSIAVAAGARNLRAMLPIQASSGPLTSLVANGMPVAYTTQTIKGMAYAFFPANAGNYVANYSADGTAPAISGVTATTHANGTVTVAWTTDEPATSRVDYGTSAGSLTSNASDPLLVTSHSVLLTNLAGSTTHHYRVTSADAAGNSRTSPNPPAAPLTFTTVPDVAPVARATGSPTSGMAPLTVQFSGATSTDADGDSLTFAWTFGDGGTGTGRVVSHTYFSAGAHAAILTVNDGRGGTDTASVALSVSPGTFPQTAVLDNFNRANGAIGANWMDETSGFSINSNQLVPAAGTSYIEWSPATFGTNQEVFTRIAAVGGASQEINLMLKTQGTTWRSGHIEVGYSAASSLVYVYTLSPPEIWTQYGAFPGVTFAVGDQFGARALSDGTVQVYKNGAQIGTASVGAWPQSGQGGRIGLSVANVSSTRFDDFGGGNVSGGVADVDPVPLGAVEAPRLSGAFPNPTRGAVQMSLVLPRQADVRLSIVDIQGRQIWSAARRPYPAGRWSLEWDGRSARGPITSGVYLAHIEVGGQRFVRRFATVR